MFKKLQSLSARFMLPLTCVVVVIIALISFVLIWNEEEAFDSFSADVFGLGEDFINQQNKAMRAVELQQFETARIALQTKSESMAQLIADLAPNVIQTFDFDTVDHYCRTLAEDPDIILAYIADSVGGLLANYRNQDDPVLREILPGIDNLSLDGVIDTLLQDESVLIVEKEVMHDMERLDTLVLTASRKSTLEQTLALLAARLQELVDGFKLRKID